MLKHRHFISYFSTALLYLLGVGMFFYLQDHSLVSSKKTEEKVIEMCLCSFTPEAVTPVEQQEEQTEEPTEEQEEPIEEEEPVVEEKTTVEPEMVKEPVKEEEPETIEKITPEPIVQKETPKPAKKSVVKKPTVKKPVVKKVKKKPKKIKKKTVIKKKKSQQKASSQRSKGSKAEKNLFLSKIRDEINKYKSYPRIAQRRGMQGTVKVTFTILSSGKVGNILVDGPTVFHKSARKAVKSAFPIDAKNAPISLPKRIHISLRYQIR